MTGYLYPVPTNPPADGSQHTCTFGEEWLPIVLDRIDDLLAGEQFDTPPADIKQQVRELLDLLEIDTTVVVNYPSYLSILGNQRRVVDGNALAFTVNASQALNGYWTQSAPAHFDQTHFRVRLAAGDYRLTAMCAKASNAGKVTVGHNGQTIATWDLYNATSQFNQVFTADFTVAVAGELTEIYFAVDDKNASSSNYNFFMTSAVIVMTSTEP